MVMVGKGSGKAKTASNSVESNMIDRMRPTTEIVNRNEMEYQLGV